MVSIITKWLLIFVRGPSIRSTSSSPLTSAVLRASSEDIRIFGEAFPRRLTYFWFSETRLNRNKILIKYKISRNLKSPQKPECGPPLSWRVYCIKLQGMVMSSEGCQGVNFSPQTDQSLPKYLLEKWDPPPSCVTRPRLHNNGPTVLTLILSRGDWREINLILFVNYWLCVRWQTFNGE